jgi:hypothetical protein
LEHDDFDAGSVRLIEQRDESLAIPDGFDVEGHDPHVWILEEELQIVRQGEADLATGADAISNAHTDVLETADHRPTETSAVSDDGYGTLDEGVPLRFGPERQHEAGRDTPDPLAVRPNEIQACGRTPEAVGQAGPGGTCLFESGGDEHDVGDAEVGQFLDGVHCRSGGDSDDRDVRRLFEIRNGWSDRMTGDVVVARIDEQDAAGIAVLFEVGENPTADAGLVRRCPDDGDRARVEERAQVVASHSLRFFSNARSSISWVTYQTL